MTLSAAIAAELPFLRAEAEALMDETFEIGSYGVGWEYNPTSGEDERAFTVAFTTPGKVLSNTSASEVEVGGRTVAQIDRVLHIPVDTDDVPANAVARSGGREFRILAELTHPQPKSRRFAVEEVLS